MILVCMSKAIIEERSKIIRSALKATDALRERLFNKYSGNCVLCDVPLQRDAPNEIDHLVSVYNWAEQKMSVEEMLYLANR